MNQICYPLQQTILHLHYNGAVYVVCSSRLECQVTQDDIVALLKQQDSTFLRVRRMDGILKHRTGKAIDRLVGSILDVDDPIEKDRALHIDGLGIRTAQGSNQRFACCHRYRILVVRPSRHTINRSPSHRAILIIYRFGYDGVIVTIAACG